MATFLEILQDASAVLELPQPENGTSTSQQNIILLRSLLNRLGREVAREISWERIIKEHSFSADASSYDIYTNITDFDYIVTKYIWDYTDNEPIINESFDDYHLDETIELQSAFTRFHLKGGSLIFEPAFTAASPHTLKFYYKSKNWVLASDGTTYKSEFTADDDTHLLDDEVLILGLIAKYKQAKGLSFAQDFDNYQVLLEKLKNRDTNLQVLNMGKMSYTAYPYANIPETGIG